MTSEEKYLKWNTRNRLTWKILELRLWSLCRERVISGPFTGMQLTGSSLNSAFFPKVLGTYEREIHGCLEDAIQASPSCIINVGAGEGYFAVGLLRRMPSAVAVCFEKDPAGTHLIGELSDANGIARARIIIRGVCDGPLLIEFISQHTSPLVIIDIEGGEDEVLSAEFVPMFRNARIIVETHDFIVPSVSNKIGERFDRTHYVTRVAAQPRHADDIAVAADWLLNCLPRYLRYYAVTEFRPPGMQWLYMVPKG